MTEMVRRKFTRTSMITGKTRTMTLSATAEQWDLMDKGALIQNSLPHLTDGEREFIMTGITDAEWDAAFPEEDEDPAGEPDRGAEPAS